MEHQTFWKPEKKVKEPKQWKSGQKPKKEIQEWKKDILSHHKSNPSKADRAIFPATVIAEAKERSKGVCEQCNAAACSTTHHVMSRGRSGRGVLSNAFRACGTCHIEIEGDEEKKQEIISLYEMKFGQYFWFDEQDWNEHARKQIAEDEAVNAKLMHTEQLDPIVELLTAATGRALRVKELRLLDKLGVGEMATFAKLLSDVIGAGLDGKQPEFGYGTFND
jgi:hypothetical protein